MADQYTLNLDTGEVEVRPPTPEETAAIAQAQAEMQAHLEERAAQDAAAAQQRAADVQTILLAMPTPESRAALARFLGVPDAG
jgi:hypothetical protein